MLLLAIVRRLNKVVLAIRSKSALDAFQLFYEELVFPRPQSNRIRRLRPAPAPAK